MIRPLSFLAALLASGACTAQPAGNGAAPQATATPAAARGDVQATSDSGKPFAGPLPPNAPETHLANKAATSGRANLPKKQPPFDITQIGDFDAPFAMAFLPDGSLLVTEKAGQLKLRRPDGTVVEVPGVPSVDTGGQGGLLDVAVAPDFATNHLIYLTYAESKAPGSQLAMARGTLDLTGAPTLTGVDVLWRSGSPGVGGQFGAKIAFAPDGKSLFLSSGERQRFSPAQDPEQALGKILHLTLDGKAWPGNPRYDQGGVKAQTWSTGHRNPYGLLFTPDGRLWEEEMGPKGGDELNLIEPGKNYGWPIVSNGDNYSGQPIPDHPSDTKFEPPKLWWNPSVSPAGMIVYSGDLFPQYKGSLFIGTMSTPGLFRAALDGATATPADYWDFPRIRDVAQAPDGSIWLLEDGGKGAPAHLLRLAPKE